MRNNGANRIPSTGAKLRPLQPVGKISPVQHSPSAATLAGPVHSNVIALRARDVAQDFDPKLAEVQLLKLVIADEHPVVLAGLAALLGDCSNIKIVGRACNGREAVDMFVAHRPDVGLFELRMPEMDGVQAVAEILAKIPAARLLIFTTCQSEEDVYRAVRAGAQGYVLKSASVEELVDSIRTVAAGQRWIPRLVADKLARRIGDRELTRRENEVLHAITTGRSNKEIGVVLHISEATVKVHVTHILEKLGASGRTDAIRLALQRGLVYPDFALAA